jgi:hypothetical protein
LGWGKSGTIYLLDTLTSCPAFAIAPIIFHHRFL